MNRLVRCLAFSPIIWLCPPAYGGDDVLPPDAGIPIIAWKDAAKYRDQQVIVQGQIVAARNIGSICFLNFDTDRSFTAIVREPDYPKFPEYPEVMYDQKIVRIRGVISEYKGKPQIEVHQPSQVTILEKELPIPPPPPEHKPRVESDVVTIAAFNVLNFFDSYNDPYTDDESTPAKPREDLEKVAAMIHQLDADILVLEEVENRGYLERFRSAMLSDMGYSDIVCFEGNDTRGIDCAVFSRFPVGPVTSHRHVRFSEGELRETRFQRDFLKVQILPPRRTPFCVFPVHFKSKRGGSETTEPTRLAEMREARRILDEVLKENRDALFVVCGDFNDTWDSVPMKALRGEGAGALRGFIQELPKDARSYNKGEFTDVIDFILASPAMARLYVANSYRIIDGSVETNGSDHNPVVAKFKFGPSK